ncbi:MAG: branched-chain amino acid aminotransferase [Desulfovibrionales bacterium]|nr:branched-chain amino acid aminotransferase [Desulfovibrionales bacterium]
MQVAKVVGSDEYLGLLLGTPRHGEQSVLAFYDHRLGAICRDPRLMLMPWDDHLVHRGDGVFETIKYIDGKMYQLEAHLDRMETSAKGIYLSLPCPRDEIREHILDTARAGGSDIGLVRVLLGRGPGGFGVDPFECPVPSLYIVAYKFTPKPENLFENGVTAFKTSIPAKQPWLAKIKSLDYLPNALMKREAEEKGFTFPLCFDAHGFLAEGATENVCIVDKQGRLIAPEFTSALRGTTLLRAVDLIKHEIPISFRGVTEGELFEAKEVIVIGTTLDAISVIRYEGKPIHDVRPGPVSKRIRELLKKDLQENGTPL